MWLMYLLSYMDRTNIGNAKVAGMTDDLRMDSNDYSVSLVVFFITYVLFEAKVQTYEQLIALRVVVGILEAGFAPGILLILSSWYKKAEQSKRFAVYISAAVLSGAFGGIIAGAITEGLEGVHGLRGWRWLFIIEGAATIGWALVAGFILPDFPANTKKFDTREKELAISRLEADEHYTRSEDGPHISSLEAMKQALFSWRVWIHIGGYMVIVGSSTLSYFYPTLVEGLGYTSHMAQYMVVPIYAVAFVCVAITGYFSDQYPAQRGLIITGWLVVAIICAIVVCVVYDFTARYALLVIMAAGLWSSNGLALSYASSAFANMPQETRAVSLALVNALGNLAQIYGAYLFPASDAPKYLLGFGVIAGMAAFGVATYIAAYVLLRK
ncbi:MFS transporter prlL [Fulvia fulva]|uniref:MFS transporter prlL n=1 Tax=Passalora fulva TaxID=5499 RepID=A0A9Q8L719_PASFU|nr:MFS transporter prlL [Fulvia fulva]KAK4635568.1 MFS transporter prlL [Fulvia fulva]KAK4638010.1 MFS transporter prlL [Fulvia fulva]UJO11393.1 MFS transporter prlL [Fulvia fulva]WPV08136.1 MFS transporter prlL [Fulvia fulva]WPV24553.1 MFS transporter prlL [Fulvia fulva]